MYIMYIYWIELPFLSLSLDLLSYISTTWLGVRMRLVLMNRSIYVKVKRSV